MKYYFLSFLLCTLIFVLIPVQDSHEPPGFHFLGHFDVRTGQTLPEEFQAEKSFNGIILTGPAETNSLMMSNGAALPLEPGEHAWVPFLGNGYFRYRKIGPEITFHSRAGELLWEKKFYSYPIGEHRGRIILLLTADGNQADIIDSNGNRTGAKRLSGHLMTDYDFASRASFSAMTFSSGELFVLDEKGEVVLEYRHDSDVRPVFFKSCALGPDGRRVAVHFQEGAQDRIIVLERREEGDKRGREIFDLKLRRVYPHLLHLAVNSSGLLIAAPDFTAFYNAKGREQWTRPLELFPGTFRPTHADRNNFVYGDTTKAVVLDGVGRTLLSLEVARQEADRWRVLPGKEPGVFAVQTPGGIDFFAVR